MVVWYSMRWLFAIPAVEVWSPWHKRFSVSNNTSRGNSWSGPWSTRSHQHLQEKDRAWILQAVQRQCWCWNRQVCQSSRCGCSSSILFKVTGLSCQWNYSTIKELLCRGSSKAEGQRWRRYCCSSPEKAWKPTTPWSKVGHKDATIPKEGQKQWRSSVSPNCNGSCLGPFYWSVQTYRVWGACETQ